MNETIETIRHSITIRLIEFKKLNPDMSSRVDEVIQTIKAECCACETDEAELVVLNKWKHRLWVVGVA